MKSKGKQDPNRTQYTYNSEGTDSGIQSPSAYIFTVSTNKLVRGMVIYLDGIHT